MNIEQDQVHTNLLLPLQNPNGPQNSKKNSYMESDFIDITRPNPPNNSSIGSNPLRFFLIDIDTETIKVNESLQEDTRIRLFGITEEKNTVLVRVENYQCHLTIECNEELLGNRTQEELERVRLSLNNQLQMKACLAPDNVITKLEIYEEKYLKIFFVHPQYLQIFKEEIVLKEPGEPYMKPTRRCEDLLAVQFLAETGMKMMSWVEIEEGGFTMEKMKTSECQIEVRSDGKNLKRTLYEASPMLRVLVIRTECEYMTRAKEETEGKLRRIMKIRNIYEEIGGEEGVKEMRFDIEEYKNEANMLRDWRRFLLAWDPDVIIGGNEVLEKDVKEIYQRAKMLKLNEYVGLGRAENRISALLNQNSDVPGMSGRVVIDILAWALKNEDEKRERIEKELTRKDGENMERVVLEVFKEMNLIEVLREKEIEAPIRLMIGKNSSGNPEILKILKFLSEIGHINCGVFVPKASLPEPPQKEKENVQKAPENISLKKVEEKPKKTEKVQEKAKEKGTKRGGKASSTTERKNGSTLYDFFKVSKLKHSNSGHSVGKEEDKSLLKKRSLIMEDKEENLEPKVEKNLKVDNIEEFKPIRRMTVNTKRWTIKVRIFGKSTKLQTERKGIWSDYFVAEGVDEDGGEISIVFNEKELVDEYYEKVVIGEIYVVSGGVLAEKVRRTYKTRNSLQILFMGDCPLRFELQENEEKFPGNHYKFTKLGDIKDEMLDVDVSVIGMVVKSKLENITKKDKNTVNVRKVVITDQYKETVELVLWDKLSEIRMNLFDVVIVNKAKIRKFNNNKHLGMTQHTQIMTNYFPNYQEIKGFYNWVMRFHADKFGNLARVFPNIEDPAVNLKEISTSRDDYGTFESRVYVSYINKKSQASYQACPNCRKNLNPTQAFGQGGGVQVATPSQDYDGNVYKSNVQIYDVGKDMQAQKVEKKLTVILGQKVLDNMGHVENFDLWTIGQKNAEQKIFFLRSPKNSEQKIDEIFSPKNYTLKLLKERKEGEIMCVYCGKYMETAETVSIASVKLMDYTETINASAFGNVAHMINPVEDQDVMETQWQEFRVKMRASLDANSDRKYTIFGVKPVDYREESLDIIRELERLKQNKRWS